MFRRCLLNTQHHCLSIKLLLHADFQEHKPLFISPCYSKLLLKDFYIVLMLVFKEITAHIRQEWNLGYYA